MTQQTEGNEQMEQSLIDIAVESWRFSRLFGKVVGKLDAGESGRYINQIRYFQKKVEESLDSNGLKLGRVIIRSQTKPWGYSLSRQPHHGGSQVNRPQEVAGGLVVTRGNAPVLLQAREEVLYQMPRLVQIAVIFALLLVRGPRGNHNGLALGQ